MMRRGRAEISRPRSASSGATSAPLAITITDRTSPNFGATRLVIPAGGTADDDHNPTRVAPRHRFDIGTGTDNLFHAEHFRAILRFGGNQPPHQGGTLPLSYDPLVRLPCPQTSR